MADHRHKRDSFFTRRKPSAKSLASSLAVVATGAAVVTGVAVKSPDQAISALDAELADDGAAASSPVSSNTVDIDDRQRAVSRSASSGRQAVTDASALTNKVAAKTSRASAVKRWVTESLNLWDGPGKHSSQVGEVEAAEVVYYTGRTELKRDEILVDKKAYWVTAGYLAKKKPEPQTGVNAPLSMAPCPDTSVESGLTSDAVRVYRAVCNAFPEIETYGGWDAHGEHTSGRAIDIMTSDVALGNAIAEFLQMHAAELNLYDIIWRQQIWTPVRASEGWRYMEDRGSTTANHYDHVHVSTNS